MTIYDEVIEVLLKGRPQSSAETITKVVEHLGEVVSKEALEIIRDKDPLSVRAIWETVKARPIIESEMRKLLSRVDRPHVLYVYSRFLNSGAVGPPLTKIALEKQK
ncbi:MAG: hypothetical protein E3J86_12255 [Candidatus Thorarchaeota archaeon]|nr:MAG: hypothetical protein E3J86_12255 [Candidatus Thorarchaeota archaeon]